MGRLPVVEGRDLVRFLQRRGFKLIRTHGSHVRLRHADGRSTTVPVHAWKELPRGTIMAILRDTDVSREDFERGV